MYVINVVGANDLSMITNWVPYHNNTAIVTIPKNSLSGDAKLFLLPILFESRWSLFNEKLNFDISGSLKQFLDKLTNEIDDKTETDVKHNDVTYIWVNP